MPLTESYAIGPTEPPVRDITLGRLLEEAETVKIVYSVEITTESALEVTALQSARFP